MTARPPIVDPTDPEVNSYGLPHDYFRELRRTSPVHWIEQEPGARRGMSEESGTGYFAITRYADVSAVSKSRDFSAAENTATIRMNQPGVTRESVEATRGLLLNQDEPHHGEMRRIVSRMFTPRAVASLHGSTRERAHALVDQALAGGKGDFVDQIAAELPLQVIADLLGVPQEDRRKVFDWSNAMLVDADPDITGDAAEAAANLTFYALELAAERKEHPRGDLITALIQATGGERGLTDEEFAYFVILLAVAGNETTRNAITHGMNAFLDHPDKWRLWREERPATMVDEVIRWATPVTVFQRTATTDVEIGGTLIPRGKRVGLFYASANFDEDVFTDPSTFDITRDPNPHLAFGGHGAHYCLGADLLRVGVDVVTTAFCFHPDRITERDRTLLLDAAHAGDATLHGSGLNPGNFGMAVPLALSGLVRELRAVSLVERADWSAYESTHITFDNMRFGSPPEQVSEEASDFLAFNADLFRQQVWLIGDALGADLDEVATEHTVATAAEPIEVADRTIAPGTVNAQRWTWTGRSGGEVRVVVDCLWSIGDAPTDWPRVQHGWTVQLEGEPSVQAHLMTLASFTEPRALEDHVRAASVATAMQVVNAIPAVCAAPPGFATTATLPLVRSLRGFGRAARDRT